MPFRIFYQNWVDEEMSKGLFLNTNPPLLVLGTNLMTPSWRYVIRPSNIP